MSAIKACRLADPPDLPILVPQKELQPGCS